MNQIDINGNLIKEGFYKNKDGGNIVLVSKESGGLVYRLGAHRPCGLDFIQMENYEPMDDADVQRYIVYLRNTADLFESELKRKA